MNRSAEIAGSDTRGVPRIGLVLCGGGGKGAYQIGCWKALRRLALSDLITVISGTSVGALNSALIAMNDLKRATRIWLELEEQRVLRTTERRKRLLGALFIATVAGRLFVRYSVAAAYLLLALLVLPVSFALLYATAGSDIPMTPDDYATVHRRLNNLPSLYWILTAVSEAAVIWQVIGHVRNQPGLRPAADETVKSVALWLGRRIAIGSNRPLLDLLKAQVNVQELHNSKAQVFATLSVETEYWDPYFPRYADWIPPDPNRPWRFRPPDSALLDHCYVPGPYIGLQSNTVEVSALAADEDVWGALLHSANLPFVFAPGSWLGKVAMDGGVIDNTPLLPVAERGCDVIIVVYLDHKERPSISDIRQQLDRRYLARVRQRLSREEATMLYQASCRSGDWEPPKRPFEVSESQVVSVVPSRPLGSTTDFSGGKRAARLMNLGYKDTVTALKNHPLLAGHVDWIFRDIEGGPFDCPEEEIAAYDAAVRRFGESREPGILERVAHVLLNKAFALESMNCPQEAIRTWDELIRRFRETQESGALDQLGDALLSKASLLERTNQPEEALAAWGELIGTLGEAQEPKLMDLVATSLVSKGLALESRKQFHDALAAWREVIRRFGDMQIPTLQNQVGSALFNQGVTLVEIGRSAEGIAAFDEIIRRFRAARTPRLRELVAKALLNKGGTLRGLNRPGECIDACDELVRRFGEARTPQLQELVAKALLNKGVALLDLKRPLESVTAYNDVVKRFDETQHLVILELAAEALLNKAAILERTGSRQDMVATCDEIVRRFARVRKPAVVSLVEKAVAQRASGASSSASRSGLS